MTGELLKAILKSILGLLLLFGFFYALSRIDGL